MKTRIKIRRGYYKYAEIEIDMPDTYLTTDEWSDVTDYLHDNSHEWEYKLEEALDKAELIQGNGMDSDDGWTDYKETEEVRYEVDPDKDSYRMGGHL